MHSIITKTVWKSGMAVVTSNAVALGGTTPDIVIQLLYFVVQAHVPPTGGGARYWLLQQHLGNNALPRW